ncbi:hypothetical protein BU24DRAFT_59583 [Aaosphaeria arxii CBS 175.79]|uniref:Uncharacterized protein n=1 Tax=Aaosphaeria arxii CBS 175.79 TaxID=1450172 RepID=A0A6A5XC91_9PLEO|nr:uncharacterized protein BU24DRAFT_59583 [Aaosphaeria arxii CBS 175.79]KAF2010529.1 hypothetical protein BU24DRAFT_59583 [Aaosphaeria arxii CBS 175.79]
MRYPLRSTPSRASRSRIIVFPVPFCSRCPFEHGFFQTFWPRTPPSPLTTIKTWAQPLGLKTSSTTARATPISHALAMFRQRPVSRLVLSKLYILSDAPSFPGSNRSCSISTVFCFLRLSSLVIHTLFQHTPTGWAAFPFFNRDIAEQSYQHHQASYRTLRHSNSPFLSELDSRRPIPSGHDSTDTITYFPISN